MSNLKKLEQYIKEATRINGEIAEIEKAAKQLAEKDATIIIDFSIPIDPSIGKKKVNVFDQHGFIKDEYLDKDAKEVPEHMNPHAMMISFLPGFLRPGGPTSCEPEKTAFKLAVSERICLQILGLALDEKQQELKKVMGRIRILSKSLI